MPQNDDAPILSDQAALGLALASLRDRQGLSQEQAAGAMGITRQAWQKYEAGERQVMLRSDLQAAVARAIGVERQDLLDEAERLKGVDVPIREPAAPTRSLILEVYRDLEPGGERRRLDLADAAGPTTSAREVTGDDMVPYANPGEVVVFDRDRYPRHGAGCVIEFTDGATRIALYDRSGRGVLTAKTLFPEEETHSWPLTEVKGVYAVTLRGV